MPQHRYLPRWLEVGAELRGRAEGFTGLDYAPGNNDSYYLHRLRLHAAVEPLPWLKLFAQAQDSRAPAFRKPVPGTVANTLDLREAYVDLGNTEKGPWVLRFGRQELIFGDERLVGALNWSNVSRTFDAARLSYKREGVRLDWFASSVVVTVNGSFDHPRTNNKLYGFYGSFDNLPGESVFEPYFLWKTNSRTVDEAGRPGDLDVYTYGLRATGKLSQRFDYDAQMALQSGHAAHDDIRAWAGHWQLGFSPWRHEKAPRLVAECNYASGDGGSGDGRRGSFDQLYPTNHGKYGIADRVGWRNMHDAMAGVEWKPDRKWKFNFDYHAFWLANRQDALYNSGGAASVRNPNATSSRVGDEVDIQASYRFNEHLQAGFGYARLFPGSYLKQSTAGSGVSFPYLMWTATF